jgi:hypothetical protein
MMMTEMELAVEQLKGESRDPGNRGRCSAG